MSLPPQERAFQRQQMLERRNRVAVLMLARKTIHEIADELGVSPVTIKRDRAAIRMMWAEELAGTAHEILAQELRAINDVETKARELYDRFPKAQYLEVILKASKRRSELLGIDAPRLVAPVTPDGQPLAPGVDTVRREIAATLSEFLRAGYTLEQVVALLEAGEGETVTAIAEEVT